MVGEPEVAGWGTTHGGAGRGGNDEGGGWKTRTDKGEEEGGVLIQRERMGPHVSKAQCRDL
jgi:hypothetical protein